MNKIIFRKILNVFCRGRLVNIYRRFGWLATQLFYGSIIRYHPDSDIGRKIFLGESFEKDELAICYKFIKEDSVILDVGANIGLHTLAFSRAAEKGLVVALEPSPETFPLLLNNIKKIPNILAIDIAASDQNGITNFFVANDDAYSSLKDTKRKEIIDVRRIWTLKLDDICELLDLKKIDLIKIDVEGLETNVVKGMSKVMKRFKPVVFCEIYQGTDSNESPEETIQLISKEGYDVFVLQGSELVSFSKHEDRYYNYFFIPAK